MIMGTCSEIAVIKRIRIKNEKNQTNQVRVGF